MIISVVIIFLLFCLFGSFLVIFALDSVFGGVDYVTGKLAADLVAKIIKQRHLENGIFYDLGSCRGSFAYKIAKALPSLKV